MYGIICSIGCPASAKNGHEISYHPFSGYPGRREWATLFQASYLLLIVTSFAAGLAIAMIGPILNAYIKKKFPERFTTVVGIYSFGIGVGATLSAALTVTFIRVSVIAGQSPLVCGQSLR